MICQSCNHESKPGAKFCGNCGGGLVAVPAAVRDTGVRAGGTSRVPEANPAVIGASDSVMIAAILSLVIPGGGQIYNNNATKGVAILAVALVLLGAFGKVAWFGVAVWAAYDVYQGAVGRAR